MSGKRKRTSAGSVLNSLAVHLKCPITHELPLDPVIAEDGIIYERKDIKQWLSQQWRSQGRRLSPATNKPMGSRLTPAVQVRTLIEEMVRSGKLDSDIATAWQEKIEGQEEVKVLKRKVEHGPGKVKAMAYLGDIYMYGLQGVKEDLPRAFGLFKRAADEGSIPGLHELGRCYVYGDGVEMNQTLGVQLVTEAAHKGNERSCYLLGCSFVLGINGLPKDPKKAVEWFKKMTSCKKSMKHCTVGEREKAAAFIASQQVNAAA